MTALLVIGIILAILFSWALIGGVVATLARPALASLSYYHPGNRVSQVRPDTNWVRCYKPALCEAENHVVMGDDYKGWFLGTAALWPFFGPFLLVYAMGDRSLNRVIDPDGYKRLNARLAKLERENEIGALNG